MNFLSKKCMPCEGGMVSLPPELVQKYLKEIPEWQLMDGNKKLGKEFVFKDFSEAMLFVNKVADIAEKEGHHPDIHISWNKVRLELTTHAIGGLSENDFIIATKINTVSD